MGAGQEIIAALPGSDLLADIERVLFTEEQIRLRLDELAAELTRSLEWIFQPGSGVRGLTFLGLLNGSIIFLADLLRRIPLPVQIDCLSVASYHGTASTGEIRFRQVDLPCLSGRWVLLLDDIFDSGLTLTRVRERILRESQVAGLTTCVLLRKQVARRTDFEPDFSGFKIGPEFVVGYGLDYFEHYRNLPFIGVLTPEAIARGATFSPQPKQAMPSAPGA